VTENPLESAAIAIAEEEAPTVAHDLEARFEAFVADHKRIAAELKGVHHFLTVFADHLKSKGVDITAQLPKIVTADDLQSPPGPADAVPADATSSTAPAQRGGPGADPNG